jgi:hypothetical protein
MSNVEYMVDFTVQSVSLGKHREVGSTEQREHAAKLQKSIWQKYSARYLPSTTAKVVPLRRMRRCSGQLVLVGALPIGALQTAFANSMPFANGIWSNLIWSLHLNIDGKSAARRLPTGNFPFFPFFHFISGNPLAQSDFAKTGPY